MKSTQRHVLLCDSDEFLLSIYKKKFESLGYKVTLARTAESCVKESEKKHPGVIIIDPLVSSGSGFGALETLRTLPKTRHIPVIIYTQLGEKQDIRRGADLGVFSYIIKSHAKAEDVLSQVQDILEKK